MGNVTKDKLFLTKSNLAVSRSNIYLGVSAVLLLGGCSTVSSVSSSVTSGVTGVFSGERAGQYADGPRRAPAFNSRPTAAPASSPSAAKMPPMVTFVSPQKSESPINSPYDQFDANGNEVSVSTEKASAPENSAPENNGNFFSRLVGSNESSSVESAPKESTAKNTVLDTGRKQLLGNPYSPKPLLNMPSLEPQIKELEPQIKEVAKEPEFEVINKVETVPEIVNTPVVKSTNIVEPTNPINVVEPVKESANENVVQESSEETLLGRIGSKLNIFDSNENDKSQEEAYPEISSVPPKPEEFDAIKRDQQQNFNELKLDHVVAQQEKQSLDHEVSGSEPALVVVPSVQPVVAPVVEEKPSPFGNKIKSLSEQPAPEKIVAPLPFPEPEGSVKENIQPIVMEEKPAIVKGKRYSFDDVMESLSEKPSSEQIVAPLPFPTPEGNVAKDNIQPTVMEEQPAIVEEQPNFFERVFMTPKEQEASEKVVAPLPVPAPEENIKDSNPPVPAIVPAIVEEEPNFFERVFMTPKEQEASEKVEAPLPVTSLEEVKVEAPSAKTVEDKAVEDKAVEDKASELKPQLEQSSESTDSTAPLPSPDIIKTMRPSRYEGRRNSTQNSAY